MTASFDLVDEPWIPCLMVKGPPAEELGLREVLARSPEIREIADPSPLVTVALHRLLLAILHRNFGPASVDEWAKIWQQGSWDISALVEYFDKWSDRFDLFSSQYPFYQAASLPSKGEHPISKLVHELASSANAATLFDHTVDAALSPAQAARYVVAYQAFVVGGLVSLEKGQDAKLFKSADAAPLAKGAACLTTGKTLFETLMLNYHWYSPGDDQPFPSEPDDRPAWERDEETQGRDRRPTGYLDLLTWQSRRVRLHPETDGEGRTSVRGAVAMKGHQLPDGWWRHDVETMMAFTRRVKAKEGEEPWPAVGFQEDRALWRDSLALFQSVQNQQQRPKTLAWLAELADEGIIWQSHHLPLDVYGISTDKAKVLFWRHERLPLPLAYLGDKKDSKKLLDRLREALGLAEAVGRLFLEGYDERRVNGKKQSVPSPVQLLAMTLLSAGDRKPDKGAVGQLVASLAPTRLYWSQLEVPFKQLLVALPEDQTRAEDGTLVFGSQQMPSWANALYRAARNAFRQATGSLDGSGRALKAVATAERELTRRLNGILKDYRKPIEEVRRESTH